MTPDVRYFLEEHIELCESDLSEFFNKVMTDLPIRYHTEIIDVLEACGVNTLPARLSNINFEIQMQTAVIYKTIPVDVFIDRHINGVLGFTGNFLKKHILMNKDMWQAELIKPSQGDWVFTSEIARM